MCELFILSSSDLLMMAFDQLGSMSYWPLNLSLCPIGLSHVEGPFFFFRKRLCCHTFLVPGHQKEVKKKWKLFRHYNDIHESAKEKKTWQRTIQNKKLTETKPKKKLSKQNKKLTKENRYAIFFVKIFNAPEKEIAWIKLNLCYINDVFEWDRDQPGSFFKFKSK